MQFFRFLMGILAIFTIPSIAIAGPKDMLMLMDALCVATDGDINAIEKMVLARGGKRLPQAVVEADPAGAKSGGKALTLSINKTRYVVMAIVQGGCGIMSQPVATKELQHEITKNYKLKVLTVDSSGGQVITSWKIQAPSQAAGGMIVLNVPKKGFGADDAASLSYLPAALVASLSQ